MSIASFKMDVAAVEKRLKEMVPTRPEVKDKAKSIANSFFNKAHSKLLYDFSTHDVTMEIKAGNMAANITNTLNGDGNLFTFLGFLDGTDPTLELEESLKNISLRQTIIRNNSVYFRIDNIPNKAEIKSVTKMTWGGGTSWAYAVENGDFNGDAALSHFIFKSWDKARSREGFQIKGYEYREDEFKSVPYITKIMEKFYNRINNAIEKI